LISKGSESSVGFLGEDVSPGSVETDGDEKRPDDAATGSLGRGSKGMGGMDERPELRVDGVGRCTDSSGST
jgi:7-keto-8-aminopelargonate synthetase-like enzyme